MSSRIILGDLNPLTDTETGSGTGTDTKAFASPPRGTKPLKSNYKTPGKTVGSHPKKLSPSRKPKPTINLGDLNPLTDTETGTGTSPRKPKGVKFADVATDSGTATDPKANTDGSESETSLDVLPRNTQKSPSSRSSSHSSPRRSSRSSGKKTSPLSSRNGRSQGQTLTFTTDYEENVNPNSRTRRTRKEAAVTFTKLQRVRSGGVGKKYGNMNPSRRDVNKTLAENLELLLPRILVVKPPKKRAKPEDTVHPAQSINLYDEVPEPVRILYLPHPLKDRSNEFYKYKFYDLYAEIADWANIYFGYPDLTQAEWFDVVPESDSIWSLVGEMPEFVQWVEMVAEEDPAMGGWDWMLKDGVSRKWLITAALVKIIKQKVFDELLFGGNKEEKEMVFAVERAMFQREGFQRQNLRAKQVRAVILNCPVTSEFYADVGTHTAQTFQLLKPLIDFLYWLPVKNGTVLPPSTLLYQDLHDIFSNAGYLALCVRLSHSIFWWQEVRPGENFNSEEQTNVDPTAWKESKDNQVIFHTKKYNEWNEEYDSATKYYRDYKAANALDSPWGKKVIEEVQRLREEKPDHISNLFRAKAKISIWPSIKRFKEGSHKDDKKNLPIWKKRGMREFPINCAMVLSYYGQVKADVNEPPLQPKLGLSEYLGIVDNGGNIINLTGPGVSQKGNRAIAAAASAVVGGVGLGLAFNGGAGLKALMSNIQTR